MWQTAMGQTCKRMQRIAGHCFQLNYGAAKAEFYPYLPSFILNLVKIDCFIDFLQNVRLWLLDDEEDYMIKFVTALKHSTSIKIINIFDYSGHLTMAVSTEMKGILCKAESVTIDCHYDMKENVLGELIAGCYSNVKYLYLIRQSNEDQWTHRIYPALEHFELKSSRSDEIPGLKTFFELNTTIKKFSVDMELFWSNRELFKKSNIKFDTLSIGFGKECDEFNTYEFKLLCRLLNDLYASGFYKNLHMHFLYPGLRIPQAFINQLASVKGLVKFHFELKTHLLLGTLRNLEELGTATNFISDLKLIPHMLSKLKRLYFIKASSDDILPFICHAKKVNKIKVECLFGLNKILDLLALNKEREKLVGAHKITIYVEEVVYFATKWAMKQKDFKLIEMKRDTSYNWTLW
ncbi:uncharacterized protein LOC116348494 [Contarinia nasturtii]|uniref:uncharacterized protein LOC116348494 n=1 Tax=Contarinia nasturtii TaxID=265458 RepID=UPI0012D4194F|nr:uncharacterized protein LOC116348494 [Contarinia nasturtii]